MNERPKVEPGHSEEVPDGDLLSRIIDFPHKFDGFRDLIEERIFEFQTDSTDPEKKPLPESVVWRKYASTDNDVHTIGVALEVDRQSKGRADYRYIGFISAQAGPIRSYRNVNGHGFFVRHDPEEGLHHVHVGLLPCADKKLTRLDKNELRTQLVRSIFSKDITRRPE